MNNRTKSRFLAVILTFAGILVLALGAACASEAGGEGVPSPATTTAVVTKPSGQQQATVAPATPDAGRTPVSVEELNARRTGNQPLDAAIDALVLGDVDSILALVKYAKVACVATPQGMGAPPKCEPGETEAVREVFPTAQCEGSYIAPFQVPQAFRTLLLNPVAMQNRVLYAVYVVPADQKNNPAWPMGDYGVVFSIPTSRGTTAQSVGIDRDGRIVNVRGACGGTAEQLVELSKATELVLPPAK